MPNDIIGACARNMLGLCASVLESWQLVSCIRYIVTSVPPLVASAVDARGHLRSVFICKTPCSGLHGESPIHTLTSVVKTLTLLADIQSGAR